LGSKYFSGIARVINQPDQIADFLEYRLKRHPIMIGIILKMDGIPARPDRDELLHYAQRLVVVRIDPVEITASPS
jgi:hypothetical protein